LAQRITVNIGFKNFNRPFFRERMLPYVCVIDADIDPNENGWWPYLALNQYTS
jgi:hypothetical protein